MKMAPFEEDHTVNEQAFKVRHQFGCHHEENPHQHVTNGPHRPFPRQRGNGHGGQRHGHHHHAFHHHGVGTGNGPNHSMEQRNWHQRHHHERFGAGTHRLGGNKRKMIRFTHKMILLVMFFTIMVTALITQLIIAPLVAMMTSPTILALTFFLAFVVAANSNTKLGKSQLSTMNFKQKKKHMKKMMNHHNHHRHHPLATTSIGPFVLWCWWSLCKRCGVRPRACRRLIRQLMRQAKRDIHTTTKFCGGNIHKKNNRRHGNNDDGHANGKQKKNRNEEEEEDGNVESIPTIRQQQRKQQRLENRLRRKLNRQNKRNKNNKNKNNKRNGVNNNNKKNRIVTDDTNNTSRDQHQDAPNAEATLLPSTTTNNNNSTTIEEPNDTVKYQDIFVTYEESEDAETFVLDIPGFDRDKIELQLVPMENEDDEGGKTNHHHPSESVQLVVRGRRENNRSGETFLFEEHFVLDGGTAKYNLDGIKCSYSDDVLEIHVDKNPKPTPQTIPIVDVSNHDEKETQK